jgi:hypothetical protein
MKDGTCPTAPVPSVINNTFITGFDLKFERTLRLSGKEREPSMVTIGILLIENKQAARSKVFFHAEKTILCRR